MNEQQLREAYVNFFESKGHTHVESSSLVPNNDPTLLFTNAGMVQFKEVFLGLKKMPFNRAVTVQKCVRAGGKHNDLDTVGRTARHHTFFEMLGNFSFGDYFKNEAIRFAWEFLTQVLALPQDKLYITVYQDDDEARAIWREVTGFSDEKIIGLGEKDNFWSMGDTGPCGPCSEIFFDRGERYSCDAEECGIGKCDCDRYMEIWNLVFMQFNRDAEGNMTPLPHPSIDTGMGLERVISILDEVDSNYEIPSMRTLITKIEQLTGQSYDAGKAGFAFRVIADHIRSCSFLIADGVLPGNEGRSYVLRRILRRAVLFGKNLGLEQPFLYQMVPTLTELMGKAYPQLVEQQDFISKVICLEEERFFTTLNDGLHLVDEIIERISAAGKKTISGQDAFQLYDTYGFPLDLTADIAEERGFKLDREGFRAAMEEQRARARAAQNKEHSAADKQQITTLLQDLPATTFLGYEQLQAEAQVLAIIVNEERQAQVLRGHDGILILNQTPFYGEGGGQLGDTGLIKNEQCRLLITETTKLPNGIFLHKFLVQQGTLAVGDCVIAAVDEEKRRDIARNHTATHMLQNALRKVLGNHVHQSGSYVTPERLRFDFAHIAALTHEEIAMLEGLVNTAIFMNMPVDIKEMTMDEAKKSGALAFFGDKYGSIVRVVNIGEVSVELCGGTHCTRTGDIGSFKIVSEVGIGAGIRRIEAVTGNNTMRFWQERFDQLLQVADLVKGSWKDVAVKVRDLQEQLHDKDREIARLNGILQGQEVDSLLTDSQQISGITVFAQAVDAPNMNVLREYADKIKDKAGSCVVILAAVADGKVMLVCSVTKDLLARKLHAGNLIKAAAGACGGGGGGRPDMAQAGGKDVSKVAEALAAAVAELTAQVNS